MTYVGQVHNGVVVLKDAPALPEGIEVSVVVESLPAMKPRRGSAEAVLRHVGAWADSADQMNEALEDLRKSKWDEVQRQQAMPEETL